MPIDYKKYPVNWKTEIRPRILKRADNKCECCHVQNHALISRDKKRGIRKDLYNGEVYDDVTGEFFYGISWRLSEWNCDHACKIVLTIAHLDHDITNNDDSNLQALCQRCHLHYDMEEHKRNRKESYEKKRRQIKIEYD